VKRFLAVACVLLLLASPAAAQSGPRLGAYYGVDLAALPHPGDQHLGLLYAAPAFGAVEWYSSLEVFFNHLADGSVWQLSINLRARPWHSGATPSPLYVGAGLDVRSGTFDPGMLVGVEVPARATRPFLEFRLFGTDIDRASYDVIGGLTFALH
jgi:hypothetical protein